MTNQDWPMIIRSFPCGEKASPGQGHLYFQNFAGTAPFTQALAEPAATPRFPAVFKYNIAPDFWK